MGNPAEALVPRIVLPPGAALSGAGADWCVATYRNVMMIHVRGEPDHPFLDATLVGHHAALGCDRGGYGVILLCAAGTKIPSAEVRSRALELRKQTQQHLRAQSVVFGGEGFWASAMRGFITHVATFTQSRVPLAMVGTDAEAVAFVVQRACAASTRPEAVLEVLRALPAGIGR